MKTCVITSLYKPYSKGGAERVVENIVDGLIKEGHQVVVVTTRPFGRDNENLPLPPTFKGGENTHPLSFSHLNGGQARENITIIRFYPWNLFWFGDIDKKPAWLRLPWHIIDVFNFQSYFKIKRILKKEKPDVVMTHNLKGIGYTVPVAVRHAGIKHAHTSHDVQLVEPSGLIYQENKKQKNNYLKNLSVKIYSFITKQLFSSPDVVISPSAWLMKFYEGRGFFKKSKKIVMKNPVSYPVPSSKEGKSKILPPLGGKDGVWEKELEDESKENTFMKAHHSLPSPQKGGGENNAPSIRNISLLDKERLGEAFLNLLYIGQIEEHKGIIFLIESLKKLSVEMRIHLDIIGIGKKMEDIKELAEGNNNIRIHGYVENKLLNKIFAQSDFLIVPSLCMENAPTVIYESFANGVPVIASNIGGICELVQEGYNGYIFQAGSFLSLKQILTKCINEKDNWNVLREKALFSIEKSSTDNYIKNLISAVEI